MGGFQGKGLLWNVLVEDNTIDFVHILVKDGEDSIVRVEGEERASRGRRGAI
jgi:hypothetical protein